MDDSGSDLEILEEIPSQLQATRSKGSKTATMGDLEIIDVSRVRRPSGDRLKVEFKRTSAKVSKKTNASGDVIKKPQRGKGIGDDELNIQSKKRAIFVIETSEESDDEHVVEPPRKRAKVTKKKDGRKRGRVQSSDSEASEDEITPIKPIPKRRQRKRKMPTPEINHSDDDDDANIEEREREEALAKELYEQVQLDTERAAALEDNLEAVLFSAAICEDRIIKQVEPRLTTTVEMGKKISKSLRSMIVHDEDDPISSSDDEEGNDRVEINKEAETWRKIPTKEPPATMAEKKRLFNKRLARLTTDFDKRVAEFESRTARHQLDEETADGHLRIKHSTQCYSLEQMKRWIIFVASKDGLNIGDFTSDHVPKYVKHLEKMRVSAGSRLDKGKFLEASTIVSYVVGTFIGLQLLNYIPAKEKFESRLPPDDKSLYDQVKSHIQAPEPRVYYPLYPIDVENFAASVNYMNAADVQTTAYVMLRSTTMLRRSSVLPTSKCESPGILLENLEFFRERGNGRLSVHITVTYFKDDKSSAAPNNTGRVITLRGLDDESTDPVKWLYIHCLQLEAFPMKTADMMARNDPFPIKPTYEKKPLFRQPTSVGTLSDRALVYDQPLMDHFAETIRLPKRNVRGHEFRRGTCEWLADETLSKQINGKGSASLCTMIRCSGAWPGRGHGPYSKGAYKNRLQLNKFAFGGGDVVASMSNSVDQRPAAYAVPKERYLTTDHRIVQAAVELCPEVKPLREAFEKTKDEYQELKDSPTFKLPDADPRTKVYRAAKAALSPTQRKDLYDARQQIDNAAKKLEKLKSSLATTYASHGNRLMVDKARRQYLPTVTTRTAVGFKDFNAACKAVEEHMRSVALYPYGPFTKRDDCDMNDLRCYFPKCKDMDRSKWCLSDFLAHLRNAHGATPYLRTDTEKSELPPSNRNLRQGDESNTSTTLVCIKPGCTKESNDLSKFMEHMHRVHHKEFSHACTGCDAKYTLSNNKGPSTHEKKFEGHEIVALELPFLDFNGLLTKTPHTKGVSPETSEHPNDGSDDEAGTSGVTAATTTNQATTTDGQPKRRKEFLSTDDTSIDAPNNADGGSSSSFFDAESPEVKAILRDMVESCSLPLAAVPDFMAKAAKLMEIAKKSSK